MAQADTATAAVSASDARFITSGLMSAVVSQERLLRAMFLRARGQGGIPGVMRDRVCGVDTQAGVACATPASGRHEHRQSR